MKPNKPRTFKLNMQKSHN